MIRALVHTTTMVLIAVLWSASVVAPGADPLEMGSRAGPSYGWPLPGRGASWQDGPALPFDWQIPLLDRLFWPPHFRLGHPDAPGRHVGLGQPLEGTSWRNRPFHVGWLCGGLFGDSLVPRRVSQDEDLFGGYRLGWDFDHYWGTELRFGFANLDLADRQSPPVRRTSRDHFWDVHLLYYPWGDARWRPYVSLGLGAASFRFQDDQRRNVDQVNFAIPFGAGLKYYWRRWLALRLAVMDNWSIGSGGLDTMHNISLTGGVEVRFGGPRVSYYPFNPSIHLW